MRDIVERLKLLVEEGGSFTYRNFASQISESGYPLTPKPEWVSWTGRTRMLLESKFGAESPVVETLALGLRERILGFDEPRFLLAKSYMIGALTLAIDAISGEYPLRSPIGLAGHPQAASGRVFIVHGHDNELKTELEVFLKNLGLDPVVLHREADRGATLLEKFELHSDVGYAFILLTPDEIAYTKDQAAVKEAARKTELRARPNVIFEFGYFVGRLGRPRVCCLYKGDVTLPSDLNGLVYKKIVHTVEEQGYGLIRELRAADYSISV